MRGPGSAQRPKGGGSPEQGPALCPLVPALRDPGGRRASHVNRVRLSPLPALRSTLPGSHCLQGGAHGLGAPRPALLASCPPSFPVPLLASGPQSSNDTKICFLFHSPHGPHVRSLLLTLPGFSPAPQGSARTRPPPVTPALLATGSTRMLVAPVAF